MKKKVLLLIYGDLNAEPRILNQFRALKHEYDLYTCGTRANRKEQAHFFNVEEILRRPTYHYSYPAPIRKFFTFFFKVRNILLGSIRKARFPHPFGHRYWQQVNFRKLRKLKAEHFDAIIVHDIGMLPIGDLLCEKHTRLIFDAHEFFLDQADSEDWHALNYEYRKYLFKTYGHRIAAMFSVNSRIAEELKKQLGVNSVAILNAKEYQALTPSVPMQNRIHLVHHGICGKKRNLEDLVALVPLLDERFVLHLYLMPSDPSVMEFIKTKAGHDPRIVLHSPIETEKIPAELNKYDIGIFLLKNDNFNYYHSLPNKFFEFVQARLMIVINPLPEMAALVQKYDLGIVNSDFSVQTLASRINSLTPQQIMNYKRNADKAARDLSAETEWKKMRDVLHQLLNAG